MDMVRYNIKIYNKDFRIYDKRHKEIFNPIEQERLKQSLARAYSFIKTPSAPKMALDIGCGTGNVTAHMLSLGAHVTAADVSDAFLTHVGKKFKDTGRVSVIKINGHDLSNIQAEKFDFAALYSVLHHVPDYLGMLREAVRVLRPGGVLYIDHEYSDSFWNQSQAYRNYIRLAVPKKKITRFFKLENYIINIEKLMNPRYHIEGDIHLWPDDHIEWDAIKKLLDEVGLEVVFEESYLLFNGVYDRDVYFRYKDSCDDMHLLVARKR